MLIGWHVNAIGAQLNLTWLDSSTDETGFALERSTGTTGAFAEITRTGPGVMAYTDSSVADATSYCYRVRAFNAVAYSDYSNLACGTPAQSFGLSVVKVGLGNGTATSTPAGINCGTSCSGSYASGTTVTLTATPATGSTFSGWSGGGCTGTGTCTVTVAATTTVTATFALQSVTLTVSKAGAGSGTVTSAPSGISCGTTCLWSYASGTALTLTATPATGSTFTGWSGGCTGTGACSVTLTAATTVTATFALPPVPPPPPGDTSTTVTINAPTVMYNTNAVVTVAVSAAAGTPTGMVSLVVDNGAPLTATLSNGQAQFILTSPSVGDHTLRASYAEQGGFAASSATGTLHVNGSGVYFSSATYNVNAGSTTATITVLRSGSTNSKVTVRYGTSDGTAHAGVDYTATSGTLTFNVGVTKKTFKVQILGSPLTAPKTVNLTLSNPSSGSALGTPSTALLTLLSTASVGTGLVAAYGFDEGAGTTSADGSGNGHTATLVGGPSWVAGQFGPALSFNGSSSYATTGLTTNLPNWTISGWVRSPAAPSTGSASGPIHREANYQINWNHPAAAFRGAAAVRVGGVWYAASFGSLAANTWYYLAATYDGQTLNAYTNGVLITGNPAPSGPSDADPNALTMGRHAAANQFFQGIVDNVRIYNRALSGAEIQQDMTHAWAWRSSSTPTGISSRL
jgi:hypothetical protein